ncbi:MAG TPA: flagellin, partial [Candidatus Cloacimonadota bacterium]|nr:flagellin [Candidatus Cloacimonadota bacterium]
MSLNINVNTNATRVAHTLNSHYSNLIKSVNRLSSGIKLNSSADNPLHYANHNIHQGDIAVFKTGLINLNEAVSMAQTAESAIDKIGDNLIKMKEIAEQATNGTYTKEQRLILHSEFVTVAIEIDRIASFTKFKDSYLLDGSISSRNNSDRMGSWYQTISREINEDKENMQGLKVQFGD